MTPGMRIVNSLNPGIGCRWIFLNIFYRTGITMIRLNTRTLRFYKMDFSKKTGIMSNSPSGLRLKTYCSIWKSTLVDPKWELQARNLTTSSSLRERTSRPPDIVLLIWGYGDQPFDRKIKYY